MSSLVHDSIKRYAFDAAESTNERSLARREVRVPCWSRVAKASLHGLPLMLALSYPWPASAEGTHEVTIEAATNTRVEYKKKGEQKYKLFCNTSGERSTCSSSIFEGTYDFRALKMPKSKSEKQSKWEPANEQDVSIESQRSISLIPVPYVQWCWSIGTNARFKEGHVDAPEGTSKVIKSGSSLCSGKIKEPKRGTYTVTLDFVDKQRYTATLARRQWNTGIAKRLEDPEVRVRLDGADVGPNLRVTKDGAAIEFKLSRLPDDFPTLIFNLPHSVDAQIVHIGTLEHVTETVTVRTNPAIPFEVSHRLRKPHLRLLGEPASAVSRVVDVATTLEYKPSKARNETGGIIEGALEFKDLPKGRRRLRIEAPGFRLDEDSRDVAIDLERPLESYEISGRRLEIAVKAEPGVEWELYRGPEQVAQGEGQGRYAVAAAGHYEFRARRLWETEFKGKADVLFEDESFEPKLRSVRKFVEAGEGCESGLVFLMPRVPGATEQFLFEVRPGVQAEIPPQFYVESQAQVFELHLRCRDAKAMRVWEPLRYSDETIPLQPTLRSVEDKTLGSLIGRDAKALSLRRVHYGRVGKPSDDDASLDGCGFVDLPLAFSHEVTMEASDPNKTPLSLNLLSPKDLALLLEHPGGSVTCVEARGHEVMTAELPAIPGKYRIAVSTKVGGGLDQPGYAIWTHRGKTISIPQATLAGQVTSQIPELRTGSGELTGLALHPGDAGSAAGVDDCVGWGAKEPAGRFDLREDGALTIYLEASGSTSSSTHDLVLTLRGPDGVIRCFDDLPRKRDQGISESYSARVEIREGERFPSGAYVAWIGRNAPGDEKTQYLLRVARGEADETP